MVDPIEQTTDLLNVIHWIHGDAMCDTERIGLWGSSFSGGHVIYAAARDLRVKATVGQVPSMDGRWAIAGDPMRSTSYQQATHRSRGKLAYPAPRAKVLGNLTGAPILEKMMRYAPVEEIVRTSHCAKLIVIAENEELFDNKDHGILAFDRAPGVKKLVTISGIKHYGIYNEARDQARSLALDWFDSHLR
ncbi:hypothetical protein N8642_00255 [bacterium]|nr:hypothetical protein [Verrucomicrobiota bacterium]MDA7644775.1 hypothetical protein [bacterium]